MQLSAKVALSISLVVAVAGALALGVALDRQEAEQHAAFEETNRDALELLGLAMAPAVAEGRHDRAQAVLDNIANFEDRFQGVEELIVLGRDKRVIASLDPTRFNDEIVDPEIAQDLERDSPMSRFASDRLFLVIPLRLEQPLGVIRATLSEERLVERLARQKRNAVLLLGATMLLVAFALHLMHRRLVALRISALAKTAAAIGEGRLDVRASTKGKDELAELGRAFNGMARAISHYTEDLESIIAERTEELEHANRRLEQLATTDQLTGVWNRRYFDDAARRAIEVARRNERPLSVVLVDTDRFKSVNDTWGHPVGDQVLVAVAAVLRDNARKADLVARIGGEEFAILMPEVGVGLAAQGAERMRAALEAEVCQRVEAIEGHVLTASFGVAGLEHAGDRLEDILSSADLALYESKQQGRNRVTVADTAPTEVRAPATDPRGEENR